MRFRTKTIIGSLGGALAGLLLGAPPVVGQTPPSRNYSVPDVRYNEWISPTKNVDTTVFIASIKNAGPFFFQPTPMYFKLRDFSVPPVGSPPQPHWTSDVSRTWCNDGDVTTPANGVGQTLTPECNDYDKALEGATKDYSSLNILTGAGHPFAPHQVTSSLMQYYPLCNLGLGLAPATPGDLIRMGWDFNKTDGYAYGGCYGVFEPVAVPGIDQKNYTASQAYVTNLVSDVGPDAMENVMPNLDAPWGDLDPVNLAFEVDPVNLPNPTTRAAVSVTVGNFVSEPALTAVSGSMGGAGGTPVGSATATDILGNVGFDIAILKRGVNAGKVVGYVNFIANRGMLGSMGCVKEAFNTTCPACTDPFNNPDYAANCQPCIDNPSDPTVAAVNSCPKVTGYSDADVSEDIELPETDDPVFIATYPYKALPINLEAIGVSGYGKELVVLNRGQINCFAKDQTTPSIRFRNPTIDAATGALKDNDGDADVDMDDSQGITLYKHDNTPVPIAVGVPGSSPEVDSCGYLTFYTVTMVGNKPKVDLITATGAAGGPPLKVPVGNNPTSLAYGDFNVDGLMDIIVANTGSQEEEINGSLSVVFCHDKTDDFTPPNPNPYAAFPTGNCRYGLVVDDTPIDNKFAAHHPWWINANAFRGHMADLHNGSTYGSTDGVEDTMIMGSAGGGKIFSFPSDAAVTFIDSFSPGQGEFGVFINGVKYDPKKPYQHWNDVILNGSAVDTASAVGSGGYDIKKLTTGNSLYPLGITSAFDDIDSYNPQMGGLDALFSNLMSMVAGGFKMSIAQYGGSTCAQLTLGYNNSRCAGLAQNGTESLNGKKMYTWDEASQDYLDGTGTANTARCLGSFTPEKRCIETTTPVYNKDGNWGPLFVGNILANLQTERGMREDGPYMFYNQNYNKTPPTPTKYIIDFQFDGTPDRTAIDGYPVKFAEHKLLADGLGAPYKLPNDGCGKTEFEVVTVVRDTNGGKGDDDCKGGICPGPDPTTPQRCWQRYGGSLYAAACCLMLETPGISPYKDNVPGTPQTCPGKDPIECCVMQNMAAKLMGSANPAIDWMAYPASDPVVTNAVYESPSSAKACQCEDDLKELNKFIGAPFSSDFVNAFKKYNCCITNNTDPMCKPPSKPCDGIADPKLKKCCEEGKTFDQCVGTCVGISDPGLKACCEAGKTLGECAPPPGTCVGIADPELKACCDAGKSFAECGKPCSGISDPGLKACCDAGKTLGECVPPPPTGKSCSDPAWGALKHCCEDHDLNSNGTIDGDAEMIDVFTDNSCVPPNDPGNPGDDHENTEGCNIIVNIIAQENSTVNFNNNNLCCQVASNTGSQVNVSTIQTCTTGGGPGPGDPCTAAVSLGIDPPAYCNPGCAANPTMPGCEKPKGQEGLAAASCECAPADPEDVVGGETISMTAAGKPTPFNCKYTAPSTSGPLALTAAANLVVETDDPFTAVDPTTAAAGGNTKSASLPTTSDTFTVWSPLLTSWRDNPVYDGKVHTKQVALDGTVLATADCAAVAKLGIQGGASGEGGCGCRFAAEGGSEDSAPQAVAVAMVLAALGLVRRRVAAKRVKKY